MTELLQIKTNADLVEYAYQQDYFAVVKTFCLSSYGSSAHRQWFHVLPLSSCMSGVGLVPWLSSFAQGRRDGADGMADSAAVHEVPRRCGTLAQVVYDYEYGGRPRVRLGHRRSVSHGAVHRIATSGAVRQMLAAIGADWTPLSPACRPTRHGSRSACVPKTASWSSASPIVMRGLQGVADLLAVLEEVHRRPPWARPVVSGAEGGRGYRPLSRTAGTSATTSSLLSTMTAPFLSYLATTKALGVPARLWRAFNYVIHNNRTSIFNNRSDLVSIFLSIELQSYGLYLLNTL